MFTEYVEAYQYNDLKTKWIGYKRNWLTIAIA